MSTSDLIGELRNSPSADANKSDRPPNQPEEVWVHSTEGTSNGSGDSPDWVRLRDQIGHLGQSVASLAQQKTSDATSAARDSAASLEADTRQRIKNNPWAAVGIAALAGFIVAKVV